MKEIIITQKKLFMYFIIFLLVVAWVIVMIPTKEKYDNEVYADKIILDQKPNDKINETVIMREMTIITDSPCKYVTHIAEQKQIRKVIQESSCYKDAKIKMNGSKGIEINKFCGNSFAEGYIILKEYNNITMIPFTYNDNEVYCI